MEIECPKCNKFYNENFCGNCGQQLKKDSEPLWKKCGECGKIEKRNRAVCETKVEEIKKMLSEFDNSYRGIKFWSLVILLAGFALMLIYLFIICSCYLSNRVVDHTMPPLAKIYLFGMLISVLFMSVLAFCDDKLDEIERRMMEKNFFSPAS